MERWIFYALLSMFFAGLTSVLAKFGMKNLSSDVALSIRTSIVFTIILLNVFIFKKVNQELSAATYKDFLFLFLSGITTSLSWIFYYRAIKEGQVSYVASIDKASIVITIVLSFFLLKEPITPKIILGGSFIVIGLLILVWK
jgi:bacterial/archaeal transporter family protein